MTAAVPLSDPLARLEEHLLFNAQRQSREKDFDMNEKPDTEALAPFGELLVSLQWLADNVGERWRVADAAALSSQTLHRRLARVAIVAGTSAIVMAVVQLAMKKIASDEATRTPAMLEAIAVASALVAVIIGVFAKVDRNWLGKRHMAERLRMLKFRALEQLPCLSEAAWKQWVEQQLTSLKGADDFRAVEKWSEEDVMDPAAAGAPTGRLDAAGRGALTMLYDVKRVLYQAQYFERRRMLYQAQTGGWRRLTLPLFLSSVVCVLMHFLVERYVADHDLAEVLAIGFLALAAVIPIVGSGVRAWFSAFELPRSASLYAAKHQALVNADKLLKADRGDIAKTQHHIAQIEHFLEQEHREWLRLLRDTEWFL
jgi:hypothetical protein